MKDTIRDGAGLLLLWIGALNGKDIVTIITCVGSAFYAANQIRTFVKPYLKRRNHEGDI